MSLYCKNRKYRKFSTLLGKALFLKKNFLQLRQHKLASMNQEILRTKVKYTKDIQLAALINDHILTADKSAHTFTDTGCYKTKIASLGKCGKGWQERKMFQKLFICTTRYKRPFTFISISLQSAAGSVQKLCDVSPVWTCSSHC